MALFLKQDEQRSKLQERLAAELQEKRRSEGYGSGAYTENVEDSRYLEGTKHTTSLAWAWVLIIIASVAVLVWLTYLLMR